MEGCLQSSQTLLPMQKDITTHQGHCFRQIVKTVNKRIKMGICSDHKVETIT